MPRIPPPIMSLVKIQLTHLVKDGEKDLAEKIALACFLIEKGPDIINKMCSTLIEGDSKEFERGEKDKSEKKPLGDRIREALDKASNSAKVFLVEKIVLGLAMSIDSGNELAYNMIESGFQKIRVGNPPYPPPNDTIDSNEYWFREADRKIKDVESVKFFTAKLKKAIKEAKLEMESIENQKKDDEASWLEDLQKDYDLYVKNFNIENEVINQKYNDLKLKYNTNTSEYENIYDNFIQPLAMQIKDINMKLSPTSYSSDEFKNYRDDIKYILEKSVGGVFDISMEKSRFAKDIYNNFIKSTHGRFYSIENQSLVMGLLYNIRDMYSTIQNSSIDGSVKSYKEDKYNEIRDNILSNLKLELGVVDQFKNRATTMLRNPKYSSSVIKEYTDNFISFLDKIREFLIVGIDKIPSLFNLSKDMVFVYTYTEPTIKTFEEFKESVNIGEDNASDGGSLRIDENTFRYNGPLDDDESVSLYCLFILRNCKLDDILYQTYHFVRRLIIKIRIFIVAVWMKIVAIVIRIKKTAIQIGEDCVEYLSGTFQTTASVGVGSSVSIITV